MKFLVNLISDSIDFLNKRRKYFIVPFIASIIIIVAIKLLLKEQETSPFDYGLF